MQHLIVVLNCLLHSLHLADLMLINPDERTYGMVAPVMLHGISIITSVYKQYMNICNQRVQST